MTFLTEGDPAVELDIYPSGRRSALKCYKTTAKREGDKLARWFEEIFFKRIAPQEFLPLATAARGYGCHPCRFGTRQSGMNNVCHPYRFRQWSRMICKNAETPSRRQET